MFQRRGRGERPTPDSEAELFRALSKGSEAAMTTVYHLHAGLIYRFSMGMCQDQSIAEEVTQEVFLALLKQPDRFDPKLASLSTWLCGIARRLIWKRLQQRQRHSPIGSSDEYIEMASPDDDPGVAMGRQKAVLAVRHGLDELSPDLREVIVLCVFEELKYEDAAQILGVPVGTVRSRLHRAKSRLTLLLRDDLATPRKDEDS
jgi:RNA polymerase sigma-70 factor, ECF subfamily